MKGYAKPLQELIEGHKIQFEIPVYQRYYDWADENCEQLLTDLVKLSKSNRSSHFFGSIVTASPDGGYNRQVIDGQQRLTTVSILLLAAIKAVRDQKLEIVDPSRVDEAYEVFLQAKYCNSDRKIKLVPIEKDMIAYDLVFASTKEDAQDVKLIADSKVTHNFNYFYKRLCSSANEWTFDNLLDAIDRLQVMSIELESSDDAQLIFESLNSTGLALTEADKIRNHILMSLSAKDQELYFTNYWEKIEQATDGNPSPFLRAYLSIKHQLSKPVNENKIYLSWKKYNEGYDRKAELEHMLLLARYYQQVTKAQTPSAKISEKMSHIKNISSDIINVFFTQFLYYADQNNLSEDEIIKVIDLVENYMARRIVCGLASNALTNIFAPLHRDVVKMMDDYQAHNGELKPSYADVVAYNLLRREGSGRFPKDSEFLEFIKTRDIYSSMSKQYQIFLFERLENARGGEYNDVAFDMRTNKASIEHIMPQTLIPQWKDMLGEDYEQVQEQYLHTFANLTLTGINSELSNHPFLIKRDGKEGKDGFALGYKDSKYRLTKDVVNCEKWTKDELEMRASKIQDTFLYLYPYPKTSFRPLANGNDEVPLSDESFDPAFRSLVGYKLFGKVEYANNKSMRWKEMLLDVVKIFNDSYPDLVMELCQKDTNFSADSYADVTYYTAFAPNKYVYTRNESNAKLNILRTLFNKCSVSQSELVFILSPMDEVSDQEDDE